MAVISNSSSAPAAAREHPPRTPNHLLPGTRCFAETLRERADLHPLAGDALRLMHEAFIARDFEFPSTDCKTLSSKQKPPKPVDSDDFAASVFRLVGSGAAAEQELESFSCLGLFGLSNPQKRNPNAVAEFGRQILWLECNSRLALLTYAASQLPSDDVKALASALAELLRKPHTYAPSLSRGETWAALAWLRSIQSAVNQEAQVQLAMAVSPPVPLPVSERDGLGSGRTMSGRIALAPKGAVSTAIAAFSGWLLLRQLVEWILRLFLGYRANAEVTISEKGLEIRESRTLLGRKLREQTTVLTMPRIQHLSREVRFARAGTYAGLAALGLGSVLGMRLFVDGLRVPGFSGPLLLLGLLIVLGGLGLDFAFANWLDSSKSRCRFLVISEDGKGFCIAGVEPTQADSILSELSSRLHPAR